MLTSKCSIQVTENITVRGEVGVALDTLAAAVGGRSSASKSSRRVSSDSTY